MIKHLQSTLIIILLSGFSCTGQIDSNENTPLVGGGCDGCELMYVGMPDDITSESYSPNWKDQGQHLKINGTLVKKDGKTPAVNVILYYWQTNSQGLYESKRKGATVHGAIRGWVKSDNDGKFYIYTQRPAPYPDLSMPSHIHFAVKEAQIRNEYYIDELVFEDDPLLTDEYRSASENRGGTGIRTVSYKDEFQVVNHKIILGLNIPNYPE